MPSYLERKMFLSVIKTLILSIKKLFFLEALACIPLGVVIKYFNFSKQNH